MRYTPVRLLHTMDTYIETEETKETKAIAEFCKIQKPAMIYLAVGPANAPLQQYPPFLRDFAKPQVCILLDPRLEEELTHERPDGVTFFYLRREFNWEYEQPFIHELCQIPEGKMIVQDYTGCDIRVYYPLAKFGPALLRKVLFDVSYSDGGCFPDFNAIQIFRTENGSGFVNPLQEPLAASRRYITADLAKKVARERNNAIYYVFALYSAQKGREEQLYWCTPDQIMRRAGWFFPVHGLPPLSVEELLIAHIMDLATIVSETKMAREYALRLMESKEYIAMTGILASMI